MKTGEDCCVFEHLKKITSTFLLPNFVISFGKKSSKAVKVFAEGRI